MTWIKADQPAELELSINGHLYPLALDARVTLLDALREQLQLTGTKKGCDHGQCGACTVLVNGRRINSCLSLALMHAGDEITTIEGLGTAFEPSLICRSDAGGASMIAFDYKRADCVPTR